MPPPRRNPFAIGAIIDRIFAIGQKARDRKEEVLHENDTTKPEYIDVEIQFVSASGLPRMDVLGSADPYFVAKIDKEVVFVSSVKPKDRSPTWNEVWRVKNVPDNAQMNVVVFDKDGGRLYDDYIGQFTTGVSVDGEKELEIVGPVLTGDRGKFCFKIAHSPSQDDDPKLKYLFDGPVRYSRHTSPTVGALTNLNSARLYSTWKMYLRSVRAFFGEDDKQHWNQNYKAARKIFKGPTSIVVRAGIRASHKSLYQRSRTNVFGVINDSSDVFDILVHSGETKKNIEGRSGDDPSSKFAHRVKPVIYTYILSAEDDSFRFSETGAAFFVDFVSKHALHSDCAEFVRYSGEFHPRPEGGWENFSEEKLDKDVKWEFVIDNNSGTYSPDPKLLPNLKALLEYNFPGFNIYAFKHDDEELKKSTKACTDYAIKFRNVKQEDLQPHLQEGEETLLKHAIHSVNPLHKQHG